MIIFAITVSVNYDDILQHMIHQNSKFLDKWFIVTSQEDTKTISLIEKSGKENIELLIYNDFYKNSKFNKGGAVLFAQNHINNNYSSSNILILDSDIYLPDNFKEKLPTFIEDDTLYGSQRIDYWSLENFKNETNGHPINGSYFIGFFQLYKQNKNYMYKDSFNCSKCDDIFRDKFKIKKKLDICVKHLGQNRDNWDGRNYSKGIF